uniref:J domain-containing protein n=1 Tax=Ananas comosus var. bracteatus TaxID=296719 RepID=A0A6V7NZJ6_ANACO|nr:unnamed protein product [Ananas comosus var. bracteatus]
MGTEQRNGRPRSYYAVLGVAADASRAEIRAAYRRLAMRWHPDRNGREPLMVDEAKRRFQVIQEAYQVLSDQKRRALYDAGLYDPVQDDEEEVEGFHDFMQEMLSLMATVRREVNFEYFKPVPVIETQCSIEDLQRMLDEMAQSFAPTQPPTYCFGGKGTSTNPKRPATYCFGGRGASTIPKRPATYCFDGRGPSTNPKRHCDRNDATTRWWSSSHVSGVDMFGHASFC